MTRLGRLNPKSSMVFVCDVQERFRSVISHMPYVIDTARRVVGSCERVLCFVRLLHAHTRVNCCVPQIRGADALHIPVVCTEQVSYHGGDCIPDVQAMLAHKPFERSLDVRRDCCAQLK